MSDLDSPLAPAPALAPRDLGTLFSSCSVASPVEGSEGSDTTPAQLLVDTRTTTPPLPPAVKVVAAKTPVPIKTGGLVLGNSLFAQPGSTPQGSPQACGKFAGGSGCGGGGGGGDGNDSGGSGEENIAPPLTPRAMNSQSLNSLNGASLARELKMNMGRVLSARSELSNGNQVWCFVVLQDI